MPLNLRTLPLALAVTCFSPAAHAQSAAKPASAPAARSARDDSTNAHGFVLSRTRPDSVYSKLGLQAGDFLESVNDVPMSDAEKAIQVLNGLKVNEPVTVRVRRAGKVEELTLPAR